jgi:hypothetical protein
METMMIIMLVLVMLLLIELMIIININSKNKLLINKLDEEENTIVAYVKKQFNLLKENDKLKSKVDNHKIIIDKQEKEINKLKKLNVDVSNFKIAELEIKYKSALNKIVERDEKNRLQDSQIIKLEKTNKEYSQRVYQLQTQRDLSKHEAIHKSNEAVKLCNEMTYKLIDLNSELELIELQLKSKLNS